MKTNRILVFAVIALLIINGAMGYLLWKGKKSSGRGGEKNMTEWMAKELNEDEKQKAEHIRLRDEHFAGMKPLSDSLNALKVNLFRLSGDVSPNDSLVQDYITKIASIHAELTQRTYQHFKKVRTILNADQQKKYDSLIQKMANRKGGPPGRPGDKRKEK